MQPHRRWASRPRVAVYPPLVARAQNGSRDAFRDLVAVFQDRAFALALALCGDVERAREAATRAFLRAHATLDELTDVNQVPEWLRDHVRRASSPAPNAGSDLLARLLELPREPLRTTTTLARIAGLDDAGVGEFLGLPESSVHNHLQAARRRLKRRAWEDLAEELAPELPSADAAFTEGVLARLP